MLSFRSAVFAIVVASGAFAQTSIISTYAGTPELRDTTGDGGPADESQLGTPSGVGVDSSGMCTSPIRRTHGSEMDHSPTGNISTVLWGVLL